MHEEHNIPTVPHPIRTLKRRRGQRMSIEERTNAQQKFLDSFKLNANITLASMLAGVDRSQIYRWQEVDDQFAAAFREAELMANDMLIAAAWQRGVKGTEKPVVSMGRQVYEEMPLLDTSGHPVLDGKGRPVMEQGKPLMERVYSDAVLLRLMSWKIPGFSERTHVEMHAQVEGKMQTDITDELRLLSKEQLAQFKVWLLEAKVQQEA